jgi:hypothetical protein
MLCKKIRHKSLNGALKHIGALRKKSDGKYGAYYCPACNAYHVTSNYQFRIL